MKDDKSYPWICIKKEPYPRVFLTRRFVHDGSEYFGPYTSGKFAHVLISIIKSLFKLRTCKLALNTKAVYNNRFKICLEYHIGNCLGPCIGKIQDEEYDEFISQVRNILKGNLSSVIQVLTRKMNSLKIINLNRLLSVLRFTIQMFFLIWKMRNMLMLIF